MLDGQNNLNIKTEPFLSSMSFRSNQDIALAAQQFMRERINQKLTLTMLCEAVAANRNKILAAFKADTGMSPFEWLRAQRLKNAKRLLKTTELPVYLIALESGYSDANNFSTAFKKEFGLNPKQYRSICL